MRFGYFTNQRVCCGRSVPEDGGQTKLGGDIHFETNGPVGNCYPCDSARFHREHFYGIAGKESIINLGKPFICPGKTDPPRNCKPGIDNLVANKDQSECVCEDGYYGSEAAGCTACKEGHYCQNGGIKQCEDHHYQDISGASSCKLCSSSGNQNGFSNVCGAGRQLIQCLQTVPASQNQTLYSNCVQCRSCKRHYISSVAGQMDCYRSSLGFTDSD